MKTFIGLNIRHLIDTNKFSQKEFGEIFGLKQGVISAYIRGIANPQVETIIQICDHFNLSIDDFLRKDISTVATKSFSTVEEPSNNFNNCEHCVDKERIIEVLERENRTLQQAIAILQGRNPSTNQTA